MSRTKRLAKILVASAKTDLLKKKYPMVRPPEIIDDIEAADPAKGKSVEWMVRQIVNGQLRWPEDRDRIVNALTAFYTIKRSPRLLKQYGVDPDLIKLAFRDLEDLADKINGVSQRPESLIQIPPDCEKIYDDGVFTVIVPKTPQAAASLASGTRWCTSNPSTAQYYMNTSPLYVWFQEGKKIAQTTKGQAMDLQDHPILLDRPFATAYYKALGKIPITRLSERVPELEEKIKGNAKAAYTYAMDVIKGRFLEGEAAILQNPAAALQYIRDIIKGPWPEAEPIIATDGAFASEYGAHVLHKRFPAGEPAILEKGDVYALMIYIREAIKGPWPEAEPIIAKDANASVNYAQHVLKAPFSLGEPVMAQNAWVALVYIQNVTKAPFPEAEPLFKKDEKTWEKYQKAILG